jgi:uncharacterized protein YbcI
MSAASESVEVDIHSESVVVTLRGLTCPAERDYARHRDGKALLERLHGDLYDAIKPVLETRIEGILGRQVLSSRLRTDPEAGIGVILLTLASEACLERR